MILFREIWKPRDPARTHTTPDRGDQTGNRHPRPDLADRSRPRDSQSSGAISPRLSDRRRRRRRFLLLCELVAELVNLARRRRELRSQVAEAGGGGDHHRHCRQYFSGDAVRARRHLGSRIVCSTRVTLIHMDWVLVDRNFTSYLVMDMTKCSRDISCADQWC